MDVVFPGRLLTGRLTSALLGAHDKALASLGLTARQGIVLLNCSRGEANTPAELAFLNGLDVSTMTRMLDRLERKDLLTRTRSRTDRRKVLVELTPKGNALVRKAIPIGARIAKDAWRGVTTEEKRILRRIVHKILTNLGHDAGL